MLQTPLHDIQSSQNARFVEWFGWEVAEDFGDPAREYASVRQKAAVFDLSYATKLNVTGRDRVRYLHSMLSNDIKGLKSGTGCYATLLTHQGHIESDLFVYALAESLLLEAGPAGANRFLATLQKYIVADAVVIEDRTHDLAILSLQGPNAQVVLEQFAEVSLAGLGALEFKTVKKPGSEWLIVHRDRTGCDGFDLWLPRGDSVRVWNDWTKDRGVRVAAPSALNLLRTEAGIPWYGVDMNDRSLPMELGLDHALSFTKGCYRGQEIVARVSHRGHLNRRLAAVVVDAHAPPQAGAEIRAGGKKIGEVTSAIPSPRLQQPLALVLLNVEYIQPGTAVEVICGADASAGEVIQTPLSRYQKDAASPSAG